MVPVLAVAIGYGIGQAIRMGARGVVGPRFAWVAAILSYITISVGTSLPGQPQMLKELLANTTFVEHVLLRGFLSLIWPFIYLVKDDNGAFAFLILAVGVVFAAKQTSTQKPQLVFGPFYQSQRNS
jgi:hypothetical protein